MRRPCLPWRIALAIISFWILPMCIFLACGGYFPGRGFVSVGQRKSWNCFVSWHGLTAMLILMALCFIAGRRALKSMLTETTGWEFAAVVLAMVLVDIWVGTGLFETQGFYHSMLGWRWQDYLSVMGGNMYRSFTATTIIFLITRPWRLVPSAGLMPTTAAGVALMLLNYFLAFSAYVTFSVSEIE